MKGTTETRNMFTHVYAVVNVVLVGTAEQVLYNFCAKIRHFYFEIASPRLPKSSEMLIWDNILLPTVSYVLYDRCSSFYISIKI